MLENLSLDTTVCLDTGWELPLVETSAVAEPQSVLPAAMAALLAGFTEAEAGAEACGASEARVVLALAFLELEWACTRAVLLARSQAEELGKALVF